jgi:hypothetical protein
MKFLLAFAAALSLPAHASAQGWRSYFMEPAVSKAVETCETTAPVDLAGTQGYSGSLNDGLCFVSIDKNTTGMIYRAYEFFGDGMLLVFNSYGAAEGPTMTSGLQFYFFPRTAALHLAMDPKAGTVSVVMADGGRATFDPASAQLSALDRGAVTVSPDLSRDARGGVTIADYRGLILEAGFHLGELPSSEPAGQSTFRSAEGQTCTVVNDEIFAYSGDDNHFKFDDAQLSAFLKKRCPALHVGF